jgi:DNA-binding HxlR family transcriptional regulator
MARRRDDDEHRSGCPVNLALEVLGDSWSLLIVRDLMFAGARHFREFLRSPERISTNILADRLKRLVAIGVITAADDPTHKQKTIYSLTEMGIELLPVLVQLGAWGRKFLPASDELSAAIELLEQGGPAMWETYMGELRHDHLGQDPGAFHAPTDHEQLQAATAAASS